MKRSDSILQQFYMSRLPKAQAGKSILPQRPLGDMGSYVPKIDPNKDAMITAAQKKDQQAKLRAQQEFIGPAAPRTAAHEAYRKKMLAQIEATNPNYNLDARGELVKSGYGEFMDKYGRNLDKFASSLETPMAIQGAGELAYGLTKLASRFGPQLSKFIRRPQAQPEVYPTIWSDLQGMNEQNVGDILDLSQDLSDKKGMFNFGVYPTKKNPDVLVKLENVKKLRELLNPEAEINSGLPALMSGIDDPHVSRALLDLDLTNKNILQGIKYPDAQYYTNAPIAGRVMTRVKGVPLDSMLPSEMAEVPTEAFQNFINRLRTLKEKNIGLDLIGENISYNPETKNISMFDLGRIPNATDAAKSNLSMHDIYGVDRDNKISRFKIQQYLQNRMRNAMNDVTSTPGEYGSEDISNMIDIINERIRNIKKAGGAVIDPRGQWAHPGRDTIVPTASGGITMKDVHYPVYGQDETGYGQMMYPGGEYTFPGQMVYEKPMMQKGGRTPIAVSNPNDPRLRAYNDSLRLYNSAERRLREFRKFGDTNNLMYVNPHPSASWLPFEHPTIAPIDRTGFVYNFDPNNLYGEVRMVRRDGSAISDRNLYDRASRLQRKLSGSSSSIIPIYKKPVQPVVLQKQQPREPIVVSDLDDPQLKAYQDSLSLYNKGLNPFLRFYDYGDASQDMRFIKSDYAPTKNWGKTKVKKSDILEDIKNIKDELNWQENKYVRKNLNDRLALLNQSLQTGVYPTNMVYPQTYSAALVYKKPTQPVILEEEPKFEKPIPIPRDTRDLGYTLPTPGQFTAPKLFEYNPDTPTKFSFTYPTGQYNEQKTMYFPTRSAWKSFVAGTRGTSTQEGDDYATATGNFKSGGQHGGLDRWFAEKWVDVKTGKTCGRQEGEKRAYPACRPSKRVSAQTPKTSSELSAQEKAKFKRSKTSSERINYNHKRN